MTFRTLLTLISMALLMGASACSTTDRAQADTPAETGAQAQGPRVNVQTDQNSEDSQAGMAQNNDRQQMMNQACPMQLEGTSRELTKLDDAVAMDYTTTGDVDALRTRVQNMAERREQMHGEGGMMQGKMHGQQGKMHGQQGHMQGKMHGQQGQMTDEQRQMRQQMMQMMSDVTVATEEIDGGMRVTLTPSDPAQTDALYEMMQSRAQMAGAQGQCPMMQMMGGGPQ